MNDENPENQTEDGTPRKSLDEMQAEAAAATAGDVQDPKSEHEVTTVTETHPAESTEAPDAEGLDPTVVGNDGEPADNES